VSDHHDHSHHHDHHQEQQEQQKAATPVPWLPKCILGPILMDPAEKMRLLMFSKMMMLPLTMLLLLLLLMMMMMATAIIPPAEGKRGRWSQKPHTPSLHKINKTEKE
jgi:hypothetical protein